MVHKLSLAVLVSLLWWSSAWVPALAQDRSRPTDTTTALVMDLSGSMADMDPSGMTKMQAAVLAAEQLVLQLGSDNDLLGTHHQLGLITFGNDATVISPLTSDPASLAPILATLVPGGRTNLGAGFQLANRLLAASAEGAARFIILMTDGNPNEGITTLEELLTRPVTEAEALGACVMTVGFGADANEALLRSIAGGSSCGQFYRAKDAFELRVAYAQTAAEAGGEKVTLLRGTVAQGETTVAGVYDVPPNQGAAAFHLLWAGSSLSLTLVDPHGRQVQPDGHRVRVVAQTASATRVLVQEPQPGAWTVGVQGVQVDQPGGEPYSVVIYTVPAPMRASPGWGLLGTVVVLATASLATYAAVRSRRRQLAGQGGP